MRGSFIIFYIIAKRIIIRNSNKPYTIYVNKECIHIDYIGFEFHYHSGYDVWAFGFVPDRSWHRLSGIASKASDWDGRTRSDWTTLSGDAGTCNVSGKKKYLALSVSRYILKINRETLWGIFRSKCNLSLRESSSALLGKCRVIQLIDKLQVCFVIFLVISVSPRSQTRS